MGLVLDYLAALPQQARSAFLDVLDSDFENGSKGRAQFDEQVDVFSVKANYFRVLIGDFSSQLRTANA